MLTPLNVLWQAMTIVAGRSNFMISFIRDSMEPLRWLSMKCDATPRFEVTVNFSGPRVVKHAKNEWPMSNGGDLMALYGVGAAWE